MASDPLASFTPQVADWFARSFEAPTEAQSQAWPAIAGGEHVLVSAPTGSGKTLAAFLWGLDRLVANPLPSREERSRTTGSGGNAAGRPASTAPTSSSERRTRLVYVSPLKALSYDVEKNLRGPLMGIQQAPANDATPAREISVAIRTGDTPQKERQAMLRTPPDVLITTPESLYLMLTSRAREFLTGVEWAIVDEIHAVAQTKRGAHLALTLERLDHLARGGDPAAPAVQRIGLSATQRPLEEVGRFLVGTGRQCTIVDTGVRKPLDLEIRVPVDDMREPGAHDVTDPAVGGMGTAAGGGDLVGAGRVDGGASVDPATEPPGTEALPSLDPQAGIEAPYADPLAGTGAGGAQTDREAQAGTEAGWARSGEHRTDGLGDDPNAATRRSIWPAIYPELLELVRAHTSTIIFVNARRAAERLAVRLNELAGEDGAPADIARAHHGSLAREERLIVEDMLKSGSLPCLVATSSLELGIDMGAVDLVLQVESPKSVTAGLQRIGRAGHNVGDVSKGRIFPKFRADLLECAVVAKRMRAAEIEATVIPRNPLDVLAQQIVAMVASPPVDGSAGADVERGADAGEPNAEVTAAANGSGAAPRASDADAGGEEWPVAALHDLVRRAHPFSDLPRALLDQVLDMLDGRYPSEEFSELRPRIVWDRVADTIRARKGARQLAIVNAGTIPDRGLYGVHLPDGRRVGELDEEMVYEARPGQTFLLGASTWRIEEITRDRVIVTPAPGAPGAIPFWKGDGIGRPAELGRAIGEFSRWAVDREPAELIDAGYDLDERAAANLVAYLREQQEATRVVPSDRTIVVERFRDEIGDWRLCVLSPFGGRVHSAWALALSARIRDEFGLESDAIWSDDGIIVHLPDADEPPGPELVLVEPDAVEDLIVGELSASALYGARFRENAARALLLPRAYPGKRTPLWQQRLKAQSLLEVAKRYGQFPIVLETYRECLRDVLDLPGLEDLLRGLHTRELSLVEVETQRASPFASSLLFDYVATYMYEGDTPNAERRAAALSLDRDLLRELLGQEELRDLIDPDALAEVEADLQRLSRRTQAANADSLHDVLRGVGDLTLAEAALRCLPAGAASRDAETDGRATGGAPLAEAEALLAVLARERRAVRMRIGGEERWIASEDAGLYRDAFGAVPPGGLPDAFLESVETPFERLVRRYARTHGPFTTRELQDRYVVDPTAVLKALEGTGDLVRGELRPEGSEREWCDPEVLRRLRRASLASLRKEVEPAEQQALARFLPAWQGVDASPSSGAGPDRLREILVPLQGLALAPAVWEQDVLPRRTGAYSPAWLDQLCAGGELVWVGAGPLGRNTGKVALYFRDDAAWLGPPPYKGDAPAGPIHDAIRTRLAGGAAFWTDLLADVRVGEPASDDAAEGDSAAGDGLPTAPRPGGGAPDPVELQEALWDLVWAGEVTNDAFAPLRAPRLSLANARREASRRFARRRRPGAPQVQGRWSLTANLFRDPPAHGPRVRAQADLLLERYGIVTRETVLAEGIPGGFSSLYGELANLETLGSARRGYFVEGLGGAQFALPAAIERLRGLRADEPAGALVLAATDPANPFGATLPWPKRNDNRRPSRVAGAHVVTLDAEPVLYVERSGKGLIALRHALEPTGTPAPWLAEALQALADHVRRGRIKRLTLERFDGDPVVGSPLEPLLVDIGFSQGPRRLTLSA